ncbi:MAG TPA: right-handed parallel beta-helix repeat-containing protein [Chthoniobacterales bacterium]|nr:right-handed parallel beta-helix repeat-containing protein [Chthoniobacterales bacterium]
MTKSYGRYLLSFAGLIVALLLAPAVDAASLTVNSPADSGGSCPGASCTLRQAIAAAASGDTINFAPGLSTINLTSGELLIEKSLTITGPGANLLTVQRSAAPGTAAFHIFHVPSFAAVTISGLLIRNGSPPSGVNGGAVDNLGTLTITGCTIADSVSAGEFSGGGAIYNDGGDPGGQLTIASSTITGNSTMGGLGGGGILDGGGRVTITNSTISGNSAGNTKGGGIYTLGALTISHSTVTGNSSQDGGGIFGQPSGNSLKVLNSIIATNTAATGPDVSGRLFSQGYVLVGNTSGMTLTGFTTGNQFNVDPILGPLQDNGGPTRTHALLSGSPAIDKGYSGGSVVTDQRGFTRPVGMPGVSGGDGSDLGAFEVQGTAGTPTTLGNISTRLRVLVGDNALIGGMIATGTATKKVIIRAIGPTLTDFGVPGALQDPTLELYQGGTLITSNDDWRQSPQQAEIQNSGLAPGKDAESAIIATLTPNQGYTAIVRGKDGTTGVGLVEAFDLEQGSASKLGNISTRGFVDVDDNVMIAGLIVGPSNGTSAKVLVRALGPTLGDFGVSGFLPDPTLDLVNSSGTVIRSNDNWKSDQRPEIEAANLAPSHDEEAALVEIVAPGAYTAIVRGSGRTIGVGLVEVYNIQ